MNSGALALRALVVDDSRAMRALLTNALVSMGVEVTTANDGVEGLERLRSGDPIDVAFVDWNMPNMNGIDMVRTVRADPARAALRIVMVTTEVESTRMTEALAAGADEYVMKPFTKAVIEATLDGLGRRAA